MYRLAFLTSSRRIKLLLNEHTYQVPFDTDHNLPAGLRKDCI